MRKRQNLLKFKYPTTKSQTIFVFNCPFCSASVKSNQHFDILSAPEISMQTAAFPRQSVHSSSEEINYFSFLSSSSSHFIITSVLNYIVLSYFSKKEVNSIEKNDLYHSVQIRRWPVQFGQNRDRTRHPVQIYDSKIKIGNKNDRSGKVKIQNWEAF